MSAISDFNKVWVQKFPGSELPPAWEEDVKNNLARHKKRVDELHAELKKEEDYVQFLESLLEELEKPRTESSSGERNVGVRSDRAQELDINDVIKDTLERRSLVHETALSALPVEEDLEEESSDGHAGDKSSSGVEIEEGGQGDDDEVNPQVGNKSTDEDGSGEDLSEDPRKEDHFVTVIEVNGFEKEKERAASSHGLPKRNGSTDDGKRLKKVPPRPPPKSFKRPGMEAGVVGNRAAAIEPPQETAIFAEEGVLPSKIKAELGRPVVFDSRKTSGGSVNGSGSHGVPSSSTTEPIIAPSISAKPSGGLPFKKFEGSKLPLPGDDEDKVTNSSNGSKRSNDIRAHQPSSPKTKFGNSQVPPPVVEKPAVNVRSKILDLVNKMESSHKPIAPNKNIEQLTPKRTNSSGRKQFQGSAMFQRAASSDPVVSDYIDPCDAEFDTRSDQIYDTPPPELDMPLQSSSLERHKADTLESRGSDKSGGVVDIEDSEPMYDTVAPDQEDDYVMLLEDGNQTGSSNNSLSKKDSSLSSIGYENVIAAGNNDAATIKSQTSVISGHSITTTTSSGTTSDTEGITGSPLPQDGEGGKNSAANYVNIDFFLSKCKRKDSRASGDSEEDEPMLLRTISYDQDVEEAAGPNEGDIPDCTVEIFDIDEGVYGTPLDSTTAYGGGSSKTEAPTMSVADQEKYAMFRYMLANIAESESAYVEVLNIMLQYMKALKATLTSSKPVLSTDDFNIIFYKIPELYSLHQKFLQGLQQKCGKLSVGRHFENLAKEIVVYGAFLQNYSRAVDTVRKCSQSNTEFADITRNIRLRSLNKNQPVSLETLLYSPVSRVQKNVEILQDLLKCLPESHPDHKSLKSALREFQSFLTEFKMIQPEQLFQGQDRNPRHLVKNSFIVELYEGHRKLRHLFLFNDVLLCAKYKASGRSEKFTFELKWYIPVVECGVIEESCEPRESAPINLVALRSQASTVRDQIKRQTSRDDPKKAKAEKQRKKLAELEAQLVLASPNLVFKVKHGNGRAYTFFLSSEFERSQWVDAIEALKSSQPSTNTHLSMPELQAWLTSCRKHLKTNMGSYLLRTGRDENLLVGDFYVLIGQLKGILRPADLYICVEVDSYGHFFRKAKTKMICESTQPCWNQDFVIELEGAQNLRVLLYEDHPRQGTLIRAKTTIELNRTWLTAAMTERKIELQDYTLTISTRFIPSEMTIRRVPTAKPSGLFGAKITQVCKREKRQVPFILTSCVREVERRGINEVGIYRVSGSASDVSKLKKAFETNSYEAEQLLKEVDIHSVTGTLKLYMRELPEALFTDEFYPKFFEAFNLQDIEMKKKTLLHLFNGLPPLNQHIIMFLLDHMVRVNGHENHNKMSLHNMATVFGPTLLRPGAKNEGGGNMDLLAAGTVDVMAQAGILYFFLTRRANGENMQPPT